MFAKLSTDLHASRATQTKLCRNQSRLWLHSFRRRQLPHTGMSAPAWSRSPFRINMNPAKNSDRRKAQKSVWEVLSSAPSDGNGCEAVLHRHPPGRQGCADSDRWAVTLLYTRPSGATHILDGIWRSSLTSLPGVTTASGSRWKLWGNSTMPGTISAFVAKTQ